MFDVNRLVFSGGQKGCPVSPIAKNQRGSEMTDRINLIMQEIERIVQAKLDDGQTVEDLEKDFDKLVLECLPALVSRNRQVETLPPSRAHRILRLMKSAEWTQVVCLSDSKV